MSSIITNQSAMVALDTLKGINKNLSMVQNEISTGKSINSARDNAAIWSISTVMETDANAFEEIATSLNLGSATIGVARTAAEGIVEDVKEIRNLIINAQEDNVDRDTIQTDIDNLIEEVQAKVSSAQFNGLNLLDSSGTVDVLSSLNRASDGTVTAGKITVNEQNLGTNAQVAETISGDGALTVGTVTGGSGGSTENLISVATVAAGDAENFVYTVGFGGGEATYSASATDTQDEIAAGLAAAINTAISDGDITLPTGATNVTSSGANVTVDLADGDTATATITSQLNVTTEQGGLYELTQIDVTDSGDPAAALTAIDAILNTAIDAASEFGSKQKRIEGQSDFISSLADSLKVGISALTDANLEEASARLQALQVQQQLGVQALSIANQAPQTLLSLFR